MDKANATRGTNEPTVTERRFCPLRLRPTAPPRRRKARGRGCHAHPRAPYSCARIAALTRRASVGKDMPSLILGDRCPANALPPPGSYSSAPSTRWRQEAPRLVWEAPSSTSLGGSGLSGQQAENALKLAQP